MPHYHFTAGIAVRYYGTLTVEADSIEAAKAAMLADGFDMCEHFEPHGSGNDDFDWNYCRPAIYLEAARVDDGEETELCENLLTEQERVEYAGPRLLAFIEQISRLTPPDDDTDDFSDRSDDALFEDAGVLSHLIRQARTIVAETATPSRPRPAPAQPWTA